MSCCRRRTRLNLNIKLSFAQTKVLYTKHWALVQMSYNAIEALYMLIGYFFKSLPLLEKIATPQLMSAQEFEVHTRFVRNNQN